MATLTISNNAASQLGTYAHDAVLLLAIQQHLLLVADFPILHTTAASFPYRPGRLAAAFVVEDQHQRPWSCNAILAELPDDILELTSFMAAVATDWPT